MKKRILLVLITALLLITNAITREPELLKNMITYNKGVTSVQTTSRTWPAANGLFYYSSDDSIHGVELWRTDGTEQGTFMLRDIYKGRGSSMPGVQCELNGYLYFQAYDTTNGIELWKTDGTTEGTVLVKDINTGDESSDPIVIGIIGNLILLRAYHPDYGFELWKTDGSADGTVLVKDISPGPGVIYKQFNWEIDNSSNPIGLGGDLKQYYLKNLDSSSILFLAKHPDYGYELWKTDGTEEGTTLLKDINPGPGYIDNSDNSINNDYTSSYIRKFVINGLLFFPAYTPETGLEWWRTDGTEEGTILLKDVYPGPTSSLSTTSSPMVCGNNLFWKANNTNYGIEIWKTDGSIEGTTILKDIWEGPKTSYPQALMAKGNELFFTASTFFNGQYLSYTYKSDGTESGTQPLIQAPIPHLYSNPFIKFKNYYYFFSDTQLWKTSDSISDAIPVKQLKNQPGDYLQSLKLLGKTDSLLFFSLERTYQVGTKWVRFYELWRTDGTELATYKIDDFFGTYKSYISNNKLFWIRFDSTMGYDMWMTDGTISGTKVLKDERNSSGSITNYGMFSVNNKILLDCEPFDIISDGTSEGTTKFNKVRIYLDENFGKNRYINIGDKAFFAGIDPLRTDLKEVDLWMTDGTENGTVLIKDLPSFSDIYNFRKFKNILIFDYWTPPNNFGNSFKELWRSDGTEAGTYKIGTGEIIDTSNEYMFIFGSYTINDKGKQIKEAKIWISDGTIEGTSKLEWLYPGNDNLQPLDYLALDIGYCIGNTYYFGAQPVPTLNYPDIGVELFKTDGTYKGTVLVKDIVPGPAIGLNGKGGNFFTKFTNIGNILIFNSGINNNGNTEQCQQIWRSDGTEAGTYQLTTLSDGVTNGAQLSLKNTIDNKAFFNYFGWETGNELWKTDGTKDGTSLAFEFAPGVNQYGNLWSGNPQIMYVINKNLIITHDTTLYFNSKFLSPYSIFRYLRGDIYVNGYILKAYNIETGEVKPLKEGLYFSGCLESIIEKNMLYFFGLTNKEGTELWKTNGESDGTSIAGDIAKTFNLAVGGGSPFDGSKTPPKLKLMNGVIYFVANDGFNGNEIYKYDTRLGLEVKDLVTCAGTPIKLANWDAVQAGSGLYQADWVPSAGLDDPFKINPTVINPTENRIYTVHIKDKVTNEETTGIVNLKVNPLPVAGISVNPSPVVTHGAKENTIYLGYGPQSVAISATGGTKYKWTSEPEGFTSVLQNNIVAPKVKTTYYVEVTNESGCSVQKSVTIDVIDVRSGKDKNKVIVCHKCSKSISVSAEDVQEHLEHGDILGDCDIYPVPLAEITVSPSPGVSPGGKAKTIYKGYGPQSVTLTATGGTKYRWTSEDDEFSSNLQSIVVSPKQKTTYYASVSYDFGCPDQKSVTIDVIDVRSGKDNDKIKICHNGKKTISVSASSVLDYLEHGDYLGECEESSRTLPEEANEQTTDSKSESIELNQNYPNPFSAYTTISFTIAEKCYVRLEILDLMGKVIYTPVGEILEAKTYNILWDKTCIDGSKAPIGNYIYRLTIGDLTKTGKMTIVD